MAEQVIVRCQVELAADSPDLRLELTDGDEPVVYCAAWWERGLIST